MSNFILIDYINTNPNNNSWGDDQAKLKGIEEVADTINSITTPCDNEAFCKIHLNNNFLNYTMET